MAKSLMLVGTASNVGKSVLCTALCRILCEDGYRVAPFKAQNMSLNSAVTPSGREIGRAQAVQAEACGLVPNEHMNPVLIKPTGPMSSQIVLQGRVYDTVSARDYFLDTKDALFAAVCESYQFLARRYDVIVMEGAGSPVEMNLKDRDIANLRAAEMADADVVLVADIDRGGVFASVVGTLQLLEPEERRRVKGIVINRFRGNPSLFADGVEWLQSYTGVPVMGVIPYIDDIGIDEEDSVALTSERYRRRASRTDDLDRGPLNRALSTEGKATDCVRIAIIQLPHLANFTDVDPLFLEPQVESYFCQQPQDLGGAVTVVLPGTKSTMRDLAWLHRMGFVSALRRFVQGGGRLLAICGGYQMLGRRVCDPLRQEGDVLEQTGLGLFPTETVIAAKKRTVQVRGELLSPFAGIPVSGYEIHMGQTRPVAAGYRPFARVQSANDTRSQEEGMVSEDGRIVGTYLHGILHNDAFRQEWVRGVLADQGIAMRTRHLVMNEVRQAAYQRLAAIVRRHLDMEQIYRLVGPRPSDR
jgi:adenosylcobyric acid synthase